MASSRVKCTFVTEKKDYSNAVYFKKLDLETEV